jgi:hypothetical protein
VITDFQRMRESLVDWHDYIHTLQETIPDIIRSSAWRTCRDYRTAMHEAIAAGNIPAFKPLLLGVNAMIADELRCEAERRESIGLPETAVEAITLRRMAAVREAGYV